MRALEGGTSSAVHALDIRARTGRVHALVLRRYVRTEWLAAEPDVPRREAAVLDLLSRSGAGLPTPQLVACDPRGAAAGGAPAVLMTRLAGRVDWSPPELRPYLTRLAAVLPGLHAVPVPAGAALPRYRAYRLGTDRPPPWARRPEVWWRAMALHAGPPPADPGKAFIHRDYHPGNVLWQDGAVSGLLDWTSACLGRPEADVGHCRANLWLRFGPEAADAFLRSYQAASGDRDYHPYWDIAAALGGLHPAAPGLADENFLAAALAQLNG